MVIRSRGIVRRKSTLPFPPLVNHFNAADYFVLKGKKKLRGQTISPGHMLLTSQLEKLRFFHSEKKDRLLSFGGNDISC